MRNIHPVFHVSQLEPYRPSTIPNREVPPPPPVEIEEQKEYEVSEILDSRIDNRLKSKIRYLVAWKGYENTEDPSSWIPADQLPHAQDAIVDFHKAYPDRPGPANSISRMGAKGTRK
jgi:hypothetical protein